MVAESVKYYVRAKYREGEKLAVDGRLVGLDEALEYLPKLAAQWPGCAIPPMIWNYVPEAGVCDENL